MNVILLAATLAIAPPEGQTSVILFESPEAARLCLDAIAGERGFQEELKRLEGENRRAHRELEELKRKPVGDMTSEEFDQRNARKKELEAAAAAATKAHVEFHTDARPDPPAERVCSEATVATLLPGVEVAWVKKDKALAQVKVVTGKHGGKIGWVPETVLRSSDAR
jgi:hypothetical protein